MMAGTREERKDRTRRPLADAAVELFTARDYESVTMAEVAARAGVSRRTAFRYFDSKDDLLLVYPARWMVVFDRVTAELADSPLMERLRLASHAIADHIEADPEPPRRAITLALSNPGPTARYAAVSRRWVDRVTAEVDGGQPGDAASRVRARLLASAVMGMIGAVCELRATGDEAMGPLLDEGFDLLVGSFAHGASRR